MDLDHCPIVAVTNQKGGVGKTTTALHLACAFAERGLRVLAIDCDPPGNLTQGFGVPIQELEVTLKDLLVERLTPWERAVVTTQNGVDLIGANPTLGQAARWMVTQTNGELRLRQRLAEIRGHYQVILLDSCPGLGTLLNSVLHAADHLIIPVDPGFYGYMGLQELQSEIEEIRAGVNPGLSVLGVLLTLSERTTIARETLDALVAQFGDLVFETQIRRCVALREAPGVGQSVFRYAPRSIGAEDYARVAAEVLERLAGLLASAEEVAHG